MQLMRYDQFMHTEDGSLEAALRQARAELAGVDAEDPEGSVPALRRARDAIDKALDEAMALAALEGTSLRQVAALAGIAPNTLSPRLGRTQALRAYSDQGRVGSVGIERARYDKERGHDEPPSGPEPAPMRFRRRRS
jgi:DNA-directed RNA polymerase specialized sigma24 family protein